MANTGYKNYLQSEHWKNLRKKKFRKGRVCGICRTDKNLEVHHLVYKHLFDVEKYDLRVFCRNCHQLIHDLMGSGFIDLDGLKVRKMYGEIKRRIRKHFKIKNNKDLIDIWNKQ